MAFLSSAKAAIFFARIRDENEACFIAGVLLVPGIGPNLQAFGSYDDIGFQVIQLTF
ncbi:MAG: hypothetical protein H6756_10745 [Candidatus Omnitrophica bacterium]|nr:hypothetical protein [Candidatus Omnitrophota bacterium]